MGQQVNAAYPDHEIPLLLVGVLKGSFCFLADLARTIERPNVLVDFVEASSYGDSCHSSGKLVINKNVIASPYRTDILIVEDIVDTGLTVFELVRRFKTSFPEGLEHPRSVAVATLLDAPGNRKYLIQPKFVGFTLQPSDFVYGYGLDLKQDKRHLPDIYRVER